MAGVIGGAIQTTFAAVAFSGAGYLFKMFDKNGYADEMHRHNIATESLAAAKEKFFENETRQRDKEQKLRQEIRDADGDLLATNKALTALRNIRVVSYGNKKFTREPKLEDFYKPSSEMQHYITLAQGLVGVPLGIAAYRWL